MAYYRDYADITVIISITVVVTGQLAWLVGNPEKPRRKGAEAKRRPGWLEQLCGST